MKRVAILAYSYPPLNAIGSQRPSKLAKYLPAFGWAPTVITVEPECRRFLEPPLDVEPLSAGAVHRTRDRSWHTWMARRFGDRSAAELDRLTFDNVRASGRLRLSALHFIYQQLLSFPDEVWPWLFEYARIEAIARDAGVQALISTSPPATTHLLAARLARALDIPWIADFRDPWTQRATRRRVPPMNRVEQWLEQRTLAGASVLVTVSDPIARDLERLHGKPALVVPNGFDPADAAGEQAPPLPLAQGRLTIVYTGTLSHGTRDPSALFAALEATIAAGELRADDLEVWLVGRNLEVARRALAEWPALAPIVHLRSPVPRAVALATQRAATALLILGSPGPEHDGVVTGKVFEYLAARRPILAFGTRGGALDRLLTETGGGVLATSAAEAGAALLHWARERRATGRILWRGDPAALARYDRRALAGRWASLLDDLTGLGEAEPEQRAQGA
jgi:glycosyltransferase involved in cell wall biosynthesis